MMISEPWYCVNQRQDLEWGWGFIGSSMERLWRLGEELHGLWVQSQGSKPHWVENVLSDFKGEEAVGPKGQSILSEVTQLVSGPGAQLS